MQLFLVEDTHAALAHDLVPFEGEIHLLDAMPLGTGTELPFRPGGAAAEQNAIAWIHAVIIIQGKLRSRAPGASRFASR